MPDKCHTLCNSNLTTDHMEMTSFYFIKYNFSVDSFWQFIDSRVACLVLLCALHVHVSFDKFSFQHLAGSSHVVRRPSKRIMKCRSLTTAVRRSSYLALVVVEPLSSPYPAPQLHNVAGRPVRAFEFLVRTMLDRPLGTGCLLDCAVRRQDPESVTDATGSGGLRGGRARRSPRASS